MKKVFISGVFDCFHDGHRHLLREAAKLGELHISINDDAYVRRRKGEGRPRDHLNVRVENVKRFVQAYVYILDKDTPIDLILTIKPDYLVVGDDYKTDGIVGLKEGQAWGCSSVIVPRIGGISTTNILKGQL